ncbi:fumarate hydratase [Mucilaginibacter sp. Bleaf8]|uniref:fumarate hydratase n=1 Tax=Mucilaginibacter sp. Bleaf8 TaxID=2834430 RepID=UPI001BD07AD5|nr:fumarate hydratase [Mucilaginibacter sp. Bleaf8]MBS7565412.1 fumarate hydratase [Mucilaginibacter sp. Bleaf8]
MKLPIFKLFPLTVLLALGSCFLALSSCSPNSNIQGKGQDYLQGEWEQRPEAVHSKLINYTLYHYKFTCDSFYVTLQSFSKVNYGADTCMNRGHWTEYAKGRYEQQHDTLMVKGFFCDSKFKIRTEGGCFRSGVYEQLFKVAGHTDSTIQLNNTADVLPVNLHLLKRITCNPKPL